MMMMMMSKRLNSNITFGAFLDVACSGMWKCVSVTNDAVQQKKPPAFRLFCFRARPGPFWSHIFTNDGTPCRVCLHPSTHLILSMFLCVCVCVCIEGLHLLRLVSTTPLFCTAHRLPDERRRRHDRWGQLRAGKPTKKKERERERTPRRMFAV